MIKKNLILNVFFVVDALLILYQYIQKKKLKIKKKEKNFYLNINLQKKFKKNKININYFSKTKKLLNVKKIYKKLNNIFVINAKYLINN